LLRLSILIPTLNRAELVGRAIDSALAQTSPDVEVIVSDNGSTDDTPAVLARYAGTGLQAYRHSSTMHIMHHAQFMLHKAGGQFIAALSDDDYLEPDFAAEVLAAFDRTPSAGFAYTGCAVHYEDIQVPALVGPPVESTADFLLNHYSGLRELSWCACVTRTRDLKEIGPVPEDRIIGDMYFWTKLAFRGPVLCVPRVLSHYTLLRPQTQDNNLSHGTSPVVWAQDSRRLADEVLNASRNAGASPEYVAKLESEARRHVARSVANQFVWTRIRGARRLDLLRWVIKCKSYLVWNWTVISRLGAALAVPRTMLRNALLKSARRMATARGGRESGAAAMAVEETQR